jgi:hypothetical protein
MDYYNKFQWIWRIRNAHTWASSFVGSEYNNDLAMQQIASTGYTVEELAKIENAFEWAELTSDDEMFDRLEAVYNELCVIHGGIDVAKANEVFVKAPVQEVKEEVAVVA